MVEQVSNPLTLVMDIKSNEHYEALKSLLEGFQKLPEDKNPIRVALRKLGIVHFARFVFLNPKQLAIITTYDGTMVDYVDAFVNEIGPVFDQLFSHVLDAPPPPVSKHRKEFLDYILKHDVPCIQPFFSAYPSLKTLDILTLQRKAQT